MKNIYKLEELRLLNTRDYHFEIRGTVVSFSITDRDEKGNIGINPHHTFWVTFGKLGYPNLAEVDEMIGELVLKVTDYLNSL